MRSTAGGGALRQEVQRRRLRSFTQGEQMTKPRIRTEGFTTTDAYLTVYFRLGLPGATRFLEAKVPMADIAADPQFGQAYERAATRLFKGRWDLDEPLLLVGCAQPPWEHCSPECNGCEQSCTHEGCVHAD